jgi:hypothetical protein
MRAIRTVAAAMPDFEDLADRFYIREVRMMLIPICSQRNVQCRLRSLQRS